MIDHEAGQPGGGGFEHRIDRGVVGQDHVNPVGAADGIGRIRDRNRTVGDQRGRLFGGPVPHPDFLPLATQRPREAGAKESRPEDRDHGIS